MAVSHLVERKLQRVSTNASVRDPLSPLNIQGHAALSAKSLRPQRAASRMPINMSGNGTSRSCASLCRLPPLIISPTSSPTALDGPPLITSASRKRLQPLTASRPLRPPSPPPPFKPPLRPISAPLSLSGPAAIGRHDWSPPVLRPRSDPGRCRIGHTALAARSPTAIGVPTPASKEQESVKLLFDSILNCYYDPKTNKYFELL